MTLKLGILIPQSNAFPAIGRDFIDGIELSAGDCGIDFHIEGIGFGTNIKQIFDCIQKLQNQHRVHLISGLIGHHQIKQLYHFFNELKSPFFYSDFGAKLPLGLKKSPFVFCNSFDLFLGAYNTGICFKEEGYNNIAISSCFYEAGYDLSLAFEKGLNKKEISGHFITPLQPREQESDLMSEYFYELQPDAIYAQYSGTFAHEYASFLQKNKLYNKYPIYTSHFTIDEPILDAYPEIFHQSKCISSWMKEDESRENMLFRKSYIEKYDREPSVSSLLGFENGKVFAELAKLEKINNSEIIKKMENITFDSPRGIFKFDAETHRTCFKQKLWKLEYAKNKITKKKINEFENDFQYILNIINAEDGSVGGWQNTYLCQ